MGSDTKPNTKVQLLDAAERAIAERGYAGTTLRNIASEADANLAAVHYHFGSKEELFRAVVARIARPVVERQLELLSALQPQAGAEAPAVEAILDAFVRPVLEFVTGDERTSVTRAQFMGRCRVEPGAVQSIANQEFSASEQACLDALQRALPDRSRSQLIWKLDLVVAALIRVQSEAGKPQALLQSKHPEDIRETLTHLVHFLSAGMRS